MLVLGDVFGIIKIYKIISLHLPVNSQGCYNKKKTYQNVNVFIEQGFTGVSFLGHDGIDSLKDTFRNYDWKLFINPLYFCRYR